MTDKVKQPGSFPPSSAAPQDANYYISMMPQLEKI